MLAPSQRKDGTPHSRVADSALTLILSVVIAAVIAAVICIPQAHAATPCEGLPTVALDNASVAASVTVAGPSFTAADGKTYTEVPPFCKVSVLATPSPDSTITIELWLPNPGWNGRFQGVGNGGYAGTSAVAVPAMISALKSGFAVATTDMGTAPSANSNADALVGHPQKWEDFGSRATHLMTTLSKQLLGSYYGQDAQYSYFNGCSTGGQQALMSAQRFPADYDGILAGSPANNRTHVHTGLLWNNIALRETPNSQFSSDQTKLVTNSVVAACNVKSGGLATDPFLTDPRSCDWDPGVLLCSSLTATNCLNADQVAAARKIYAGPQNPVNGHRIFPGSIRGGETDSQFGWSAQGRNSEPQFASLFKWTFGLTWMASTYDFNQHMASVDSLLGITLNANNPDLSQFKARGGKLIGYHGWADPVISPQDSINYYQRVVATQGQNATQGLKRTQDFYRLFMVPGMAHCAFGTGANAFGNLFSGLVYAAPPPASSRENDAMVALQAWVEAGKAPVRIVATKYVQDVPELGIQMQRPICPYPQMPRYSGSGDVNAASSFVCAEGPNTVNQMPASEYLH
ncbi:tannase/feruloyl esterase family alpha/beta hydrolase [soil metagenome]